MPELTYVTVCVAITLAHVLGATLFHVWRSGSVVFHSSTILVHAFRACNVAAVLQATAFCCLALGVLKVYMRLVLLWLELPSWRCSDLDCWSRSSFVPSSRLPPSSIGVLCGA